MAYLTFNPMKSGGVTRNPYKDGKMGLFAVNFSNLEFSVNGMQVPTAEVIAAMPHMRVVVKLKRDENGSVVVNAIGTPETEVVEGNVVIKGTPLRCNCSLRQYKVSRWWELELTNDNDTVIAGSGLLGEFGYGINN